MPRISRNLQIIKSMNEIIFLTFEEVLKIHDEQINRFGGLHGTRDQGLLKSALFAPQATYQGQYLLDGIYTMAAVYAHSLIKNHPFLDGNKRTGIATSLIFLTANDSFVSFKENDVFELALQIATSKISPEEIAELYRKKSS